MEVTKTPYEDYLRQSIIEEKARLDSLYNVFAKSNPIKKQILKRQIEEAMQNIELLSSDLEKYSHGLSWLREPSKERDEKAEHLPKLEKEAVSPAPAVKSAAPGQAKPVSTRPTIGKPIGSTSTSQTSQATAPRPSVGTAIARPKIGSPVGTPSAQVPSTSPQTQSSGTTPPSKPVVGTPVKRPVIGTPISAQKKTDENQETKDNEST